MEKKLVLLIDDDPDDVEIFIEAVKALSRDIEVKSISNSLVALHSLKEATQFPDIIFLDMEMPYVNGMQFLQEVEKVPRLSLIKIIIYSSHSVAALQEITKMPVGLSYITKPDNFDGLVEALGSIL